MGWGKRQPKDEFKPGRIEFEIEVDEKNRRLTVELSQILLRKLAYFNAKTGEIVAMVGGYADFYTNKFNNAATSLSTDWLSIQTFHLHGGC